MDTARLPRGAGEGRWVLAGAVSVAGKAIICHAMLVGGTGGRHCAALHVWFLLHDEAYRALHHNEFLTGMYKNLTSEQVRR